MARLSVPTAARLPSTLRVDASNPAISKTLNRLSRESLISLALDWLHENTISNALPFLNRPRPDDDEEEDEDDPDDLYPPCRSIEDLRQLYLDMQDQKGSKRDVVSRILEGDWRHGLTMYQLAMADLRYLDDHPTSQKWSAHQILPLKTPHKDSNDEEVLKVNEESLDIPHFHPATFLQRLQDQVLPDVKAHYHFYRPKDFPVLLLRIFVIDSPYNSALALSNLNGSGSAASFDSSRTVYLAFPDGSPALYITKSQRTGATGLGESKSLQSLIVDGVPKALSRPRQRYTLKASNLTSRNLGVLLDKKGSGRGNAAGGGWSIYADGKQKDSPLDPVLPTPPFSRESSHPDATGKRQLPFRPNEQAAKRAKIAAQARFGTSAIMTDGKGVEKAEFILRDPFPSSGDPIGDDEDDPPEEDPQPSNRRRSQLNTLLEQVNEEEEPDNAQEIPGWTPTVKITLQGPHVFAGVRQLVEAGIIDGGRMPGWLTGEEAVSVGVVKHGRVTGNKGSGL